MQLTKDILLILLAHRRFLVTLVVAAVLAAIAATYVLPTKYEASALVLIRPQQSLQPESNVPTGKEVLDFPVTNSVPYDVPGKTYIEIIKSEAVVSEIVEKLHLDRERPESTDGFLGELRKDLKDRAKTFANATLQTLKYGRVAPEDPFREAVEDVRDQIDLFATKDTLVFELTYVSKYPEEAAAVANAAVEIFAAYLSELGQKLAGTERRFIEAQLEKSEEELDAARKALRLYKDEHGTLSLNQEYEEQLALVATLEEDLAKTEADLAGVRRQYTEENPKVRTLVGVRQQLRLEIATRKASFVDLPEREKQVAALELRVKVAEDNYEFIQRKFEEAKVREVRSLTEIALVSPAATPRFPSKPIKIFYAIAAAILSTALGLALVLLNETQRAVVRSVADVSERVGIPVLATVPFDGGQRSRWRRARSRLAGRPAS